jgi:hypothetical protein
MWVFCRRIARKTLLSAIVSLKDLGENTSLTSTFLKNHQKPTLNNNVEIIIHFKKFILNDLIQLY